ncbi:MAG: O-antigen ligase family protein [Vicingaceae bacterium]
MNIAINIKNTLSNSRGWFLLCLSAIAIGLSLSKPLISLGLFALFVVWLIDGNIPGKIKAFLANKTAVIISSIYLISVLGLIHTSNFDYAFDDLRRKITILALPILITGFKPITKKELHFLLQLFTVSVLTSTLWSLFVFLGGLNEEIVEIRALSRFTSHIRFGLAIALSAFFAVYFVIKEPSTTIKILWGLIFCWLIYSIVLFHLFTGGVAFVITVILLLFILGYNSKIILKKRVSLIVFSTLVLFSIFYIRNIINDFYEAEQNTPLKELAHTKYGERYSASSNNIVNSSKENGFYINRNIAWSELENAWDKRSSLKFHAKDLKGQNLQETLIRFITSKGLRKDREAIESLSQQEISAIERGVPNYKYLEMNGFQIRIHKIVWEYNNYIKSNGKHVNGHSILMRWEYWKTALSIIKQHLVFGVGTGDVQDVFNQYYENNNSPLHLKNRLHSHNQMLTYGVSFGLIGVLWFLLCLALPFFRHQLLKNYIYLAFFILFMLSTLTEDTLETQVGAAFFAFFNTLFLLHPKYQITS